MSRITDREALQRWEAYRKSVISATPVPDETVAEKQKRMAFLEANPEEWFKFYFPQYAYADPADFHKKATKRIFKNKRWYEVRAWSRELAKDTRTMFEMLMLAMLGEIKTVLLTSHSQDQAVDYLQPYKINLESNQRLINDYGEQKGLRGWEPDRFTTSNGVSFRAIGSGQSPRGTRNEFARPDVIIVNDMDTDEKSRNEERVNNDWKWIEKALIPTVSVSNDVRIIFLGNVISKKGIIVKAMEKADHVDIINIRDDEGKSTWPQKNSEEKIDWLLSKLSYTAIQQEYYNNPITEGTVFREMYWKRVARITDYRFLVIYTDPSFKDSRKNDFKATVLMGKYKNEYHIIKAFLKQTTTAEMVSWMKSIHDFVDGRVPLYNYMEANATQDIILEKAKLIILDNGWNFSIIGDDRKKGDKFSRIESALEPINREQKLFLNLAEKENEHMKRLEEQFLALEPKLGGHDDGPDAVEGGKWIIDKKIVASEPVTIGKRTGNFKNTHKF